MLLNFLVDKVSVNKLTREKVSKTMLTHPIPIDKLTFFPCQLIPCPLVNRES